MGLKGKMIGQTEVKHSGVGDVFHDILATRPHDLTTASPDKVQAFDLLEGQLGVPGSKFRTHYSRDGKDQVSIQIVDKIDEENQTVVFKQIGGDLMEVYNSFSITFHIDTKGEDNLVTVTLDYEKIKEENPHPGTFLNYFLHLIEDIEAHHESTSQKA